MKFLNETKPTIRNILAKLSQRSLLVRVGKIITVLWVVGFIVFIVTVKLLQDASFGPLQKAAWKGDLSLVKLLIEQGTPVNKSCDFNRWTALHAATHKGYVEIAEFLIKHGADVNVKDKDGYTALHNTADSFLKGFPRKRTEVDRNRIAALLLKHGANVNATTNHGETVLHGAALTNNVGLVQFLLKKGADSNIQQSQGITPLHFALSAGENRLEVVRLLLSHGADLNVTDENGRTPKDYAEDYHPKLLELLE